jgi:hypothetical protein
VIELSFEAWRAVEAVGGLRQIIDIDSSQL